MFYQDHDPIGGQHRIVQANQAGTVLRIGEWTPYAAIASLNSGGKSAVVVTDYHKGGPLVPGQIYFLLPQEGA